ncbi:MAG: response regulator [Dechloromonas sp.]|nr:response regulator [Dechloromonas sp.]
MASPSPTTPFVSRSLRSAAWHSALLLAAALAVIWLLAFRELAAGRAAALAEARHGAELQAQVFAEYGRGQIQQADQALLDLRELWSVDPGGFAERVRRRLSLLDGLILRVVAVDARGEVVHDSLGGGGTAADLGFFRTPASDRLHIGRPRPGGSPDAWLFPLSRPLPGGGALFAWVSPERFAGYGKGLVSGELAAASVVADSGEIMARHPGGASVVGRRVDNVPFLAPDAPLSGHFRRVAQTDGVERIYGYHRVPDYGMSFVIGYELGEVLAPQEAEQRIVLASATGFSLAMLALALAFHRIRRARRRSEARLAESRAMLNSAIDTIGEGFAIYDGNDRLAYCNDQYRAYYPTSADLLVPGNSYEHILRTAAARGQFKEAVGRIDAWVAERLAEHRGGACDLVEALDDGRWVRIRERRTADGFIVGFRMDITELCVAREQAEAASRAKSDFLSSMSHELRTPLNAILGMSELCLMTRLDAQQGNYVTKIRRAADHLLGVINDTLDLSRIEAGKLSLERVPFDLEDLLDELTELLATRVEEKGLELCVDLDPSASGEFVGDPLRLKQVLINLLGNAIKFSEHGTLTLAVAQQSLGAGGVVLHFRVSDEGIGISPEQQAALFCPFGQAEGSTTRRYGGSGLGLTISKRLVEFMGGRIWLDSRPGEGSTFHFTVRLGVAPSRSAESAVLPPLPAGARVLLVEDNPRLAGVLGRQCAALGLAVDCRASAGAAMAALEAAPDGYAAALVDWRLAGASGVRTVLALRQQAAGRLPMLLLTPHSGNPAGSGLAGGIARLAKPCGTRRLHRALAGIIAGELPEVPEPPAPVVPDLDAVAHLQGAEVLLVDDNELNLELVADLLATAGLRVRQAADGAQAVAAVLERRPDAVLMDCQMPVMDGIAATRALRTHPELADLPIIALTAGALSEDRERCLAAGMDAFVTKPVHLDTLLRTLGGLVRRTAPAATAIPPTPAPGAVASAGDEDRPLPELPGIDIAAGLEAVRGKTALFRRLLARFRDSYGVEFVADFEAALAVDRATALRLAHTLKGLARNLGIRGVGDLAEQVERELKADAAVPPPALPALFDELARVRGSLAALA